MPSSDLYLTCSCGQRVPVTLGMAETHVRCRCGKTLSVPTFRELRQQLGAAGEDAEAVERTHRRRLAIGVTGALLAVLVFAVTGVIVTKSLAPPPRSGAAVEGIPFIRDPERLEAGTTAEDFDAAVKRSPLMAKSSFPLSDKLTEDLTPKVEEFTPRANPPTVAVKDPAATFSEFCSTCHVLPSADVEPKGLWPAKLRQMYRYAQGPRPLPPERIPPIEAAIEYWTSLAPASLPLREDAMASPMSEQIFRSRLISLDVIPKPSAISCVKFVRMADDGPVQLLISDMGHGLVVLWTPSEPENTATVVGRIPHPSHTHVVDLDGDGRRDILVANLGDFWPVDTTKGSVVWLRNRGGQRFDPIVLIDGLGRVNDVQSGDFDSDGDLDLIVGVFGNLQGGGVLYLENACRDCSLPEFEAMGVDFRTGTTDVPVCDLNGDGDLDFVALQAQEHDHILAFLNQGWGTFRAQTIYQAPHPRWGSTGIRLLDMDGDGDQDVLYNHGDAFQFPPVPRPFHGVSWLENEGRFPFTYHRLTYLPGVHTSLPADLDGDGDLDIVCSAFVPGFDPNWSDADQGDAVIWLEQTSPGRYRRWALEKRIPYHACGDIGDYDGDGDDDIVLGNFLLLLFDNVPTQACLTVLENQLVPAAAVKEKP
jgi:hypothetical protein